MQSLIEAFYGKISDKVYLERLMNKSNEPSFILKKNIIILINEQAKKIINEIFKVEESNILYTPIQNYFPEILEFIHQIEKENKPFLDNVKLIQQNKIFYLKILNITSSVFQIIITSIERIKKSQLKTILRLNFKILKTSPIFLIKLLKEFLL